MKDWETFVYPIVINLCIILVWRSLKIAVNGKLNPNIVDDIINWIYYPFIYFTVKYFYDANNKKEGK